MLPLFSFSCRAGHAARVLVQFTIFQLQGRDMLPVFSFSCRAATCCLCSRSVAGPDMLPVFSFSSQYFSCRAGHAACVLVQLQGRTCCLCSRSVLESRSACSVWFGFCSVTVICTKFEVFSFICSWDRSGLHIQLSCLLSGRSESLRPSTDICHCPPTMGLALSAPDTRGIPDYKSGLRYTDHAPFLKSII